MMKHPGPLVVVLEDIILAGHITAQKHIEPTSEKEGSWILYRRMAGFPQIHFIFSVMHLSLARFKAQPNSTQSLSTQIKLFCSTFHAIPRQCWFPWTRIFYLWGQREPQGQNGAPNGEIEPSPQEQHLMRWTHFHTNEKVAVKIHGYLKAG